ncbi:hypothetical protein P8452_32152 [Trifolium repens]|nr:hypothetical protein P8452_32152 [Trifolium repens]
MRNGICRRRRRGMGSVGIEVDGEGLASGRSNLDVKVDLDEEDVRCACEVRGADPATMKKFRRRRLYAWGRIEGDLLKLRR